MVRAGLRLDMQNSSQERRRNSAPPPPKPRGGRQALAGVRRASRSGSVSVTTTHALFASKVQRKVSNQIVILPLLNHPRSADIAAVACNSTMHLWVTR